MVEKDIEGNYTNFLIISRFNSIFHQIRLNTGFFKRLF